jgi:hypothetical protein
MLFIIFESSRLQVNHLDNPMLKKHNEHIENKSKAKLKMNQNLTVREHQEPREEQLKKKAQEGNLR